MTIDKDVSGVCVHLMPLNKCKVYAKIIIFLMILPGYLKAQQLSAERIRENGSFYSKHISYSVSGRLYDVNPQFQFSSLVFKVPSEYSFDPLFMIVNNDTIQIKESNHNDQQNDFKYSSLVVFDSLLTEFKFYSGNIEGPIYISYFNGLSDQVFNKRKKQRVEETCDKPSAVDQSVWRSGLPRPNYNRINNEVDHIIIHHSATFNSLSNYTNVVRNIYLFHTLDRGWSDIGYNFLIAQDGTVFQGRSFGDASLESEVVFC